MKLTILAALLVTAGAFAACAQDDAGDGASGDLDGGVRLPEDDAGDTGADAEAGVDVDPCRPDTLCPNDLFGAPDARTFDVRTRINVIRGRSATDVWAAGAVGSLAHFDGATWSRSESVTRETLRALWLRERSELSMISMSPVATLARGIDLAPAEGTARSADGWLRAKDTPAPASLSKNITSVWGAPQGAWAWGTSSFVDASYSDVGSKNGLWRAKITDDGTSIEVDPVLPEGACRTLGCWWLTSVHGATPNDLWAVGRNGVTLRIGDAQGVAPTVTAIDSQTWAMLYGVWAASATEAFAVGGVGTIRHFVAGEVRDEKADPPAVGALHAVWGTSASDVWAVGDEACVLHFDGARWSRVEVTGLGGRRPDLFTVWTGSPGHVWIGGDGVILSIGGKP